MQDFKRPRALKATEIQTALSNLIGWSVTNGKLHKEFKFPDFNAAFAFMSAVALKAEKLDHHPEWFNVYNKVIVDLVTHECSTPGAAISELDIKMAEFMDHRSFK